MKLKILEQTFTIIKLSPEEAIPSWGISGDIFSVTRTSEELSIICPSKLLADKEEFKHIEDDWKCIKIEGVLDFELTGILTSLATPLAENEISIFALSTFNTDYILVKSQSLDKARTVLESEGHSFTV